LFCVDNYGHDETQLGLSGGGIYHDVGEQYVFQAEIRGIDHSHFLMWAEDTFELIANMQQGFERPHGHAPKPSFPGAIGEHESTSYGTHPLPTHQISECALGNEELEEATKCVPVEGCVGAR
jgi:hypothetical protein